MNKSYDDIIHLPHHVSATHPHMSMAERAAQFSPFAALTGYEDVLTETARKTEQKIELDETIQTTDGSQIPICSLLKIESDFF